MAEQKKPQSQGTQAEGKLAHGEGAQRGGAMRRFEDPFAQMEWMFDQLQRNFFGTPWGGMLGSPWRGMGGMGMGQTERLAHLDVQDTGKELVVRAEIPGIDPKDLKVECRDGVLTLQAETRQEASGNESEWRYASFYRQIPLPPDADVDAGQASCRHGVVTIRFPKRQEDEGVRRIPITAETHEEREKGREKAA